MTSTVSGHAGVLSGLLAAPEILVAPGCYDALSAALIERTGFGAAYLSGASIAYTRFGRPDIGLVSMSEVAETIAVIRERVTLPLIADGDTGFGNALNVQRTVRAFERMGASAIQLEDQQMPKRCGHLQGKSVIRWQEMAGKVRAAVDARESGMLVIARTRPPGKITIEKPSDWSSAAFITGVLPPSTMLAISGTRPRKRARAACMSSTPRSASMKSMSAPASR